MTARTGAGSRTADVTSLQSLKPLPTASERAAQVIRENVFEGLFQPGTALPESMLAQALQVSRNTVREALRVLMNEHLLSYEPHKGVSVRLLEEEDVRDIYASRRMIELSAIDALAEGRAALPDDAFTASLLAAQQAAEADDWRAAGTANLRFHAELVAVHASTRIDEFFQRLMTEMRLGFLTVGHPKTFHEPYLQRNHDLAARLRDQAYAEARVELSRYLEDASRQVADAVAAAHRA